MALDVCKELLITPAMHVLFIGFVWPEPRSSAAGQNILSYINACVAEGWQVSFASAAQTTEKSADLTELGVNSIEIELNCDSFNGVVEKLNPDIVIFDRFLSFEQYAWRVKESCPSALLVLDLEDLHGLRRARELHCKQETKTDAFFGSDNILTQSELLHNDVTIRELASIYQADLSLSLSSFEHDLLRNHFNVRSDNTCHVPFILPPFSDKKALTYDKTQDFIFIGSFRHAPNVDAVECLKHKCWPKIYSELKPQFPNISCHVYGSYLSPRIKQLDNAASNFHVHGYVEDHEAAIAQSRVMLAPIRFGAGVKGKLLDAMLNYTPSVTTPIGAEGISDLAWSGAITNNIDEFVQAAVRLYTQEHEWHHANNNAKAILQAHYTNNSSNLINRLAQAKRNQSQARQQNILQQLLWTQQFQAAKYMSQWIAEKHKHK